MLDYTSESRTRLALEHAERLADDMRRSRPLTADVAGHPRRARVGDLLGRLKRLGSRKGAERTLPAFHA